MASRKRKVAVEEQVAKPATTASTRVTRSETRRVNSNSAVSPAQASKKKGKTAKKGKVKPEEKEEPETRTKAENVEKKENEKEGKEETDGDGPKKTIVIEHCKQCNSFKTRAIQVKNGLENAVPGTNVLLNPDKPRRGCFEIREEGGEKFISLLDMKRPFKPMKDLDMDKVISDIIDMVK